MDLYVLHCCQCQVVCVCVCDSVSKPCDENLCFLFAMIQTQDRGFLFPFISSYSC